MSPKTIVELNFLRSQTGPWEKLCPATHLSACLGQPSSTEDSSFHRSVLCRVLNVEQWHKGSRECDCQCSQWAVAAKKKREPGESEEAVSPVPSADVLRSVVGCVRHCMGNCYIVRHGVKNSIVFKELVLGCHRTCSLCGGAEQRGLVPTTSESLQRPRVSRCLLKNTKQSRSFCHFEYTASWP